MEAWAWRGVLRTALASAAPCGAGFLCDGLLPLECLLGSGRPDGWIDGWEVKVGRAGQGTCTACWGQCNLGE